MEKKNNSNVLWIVIVVLVAIIALGIGWYLGGKKYDKDHDQVEKEVKETIKTDDEIFADVEKKVGYLLGIDQLGENVLFAKTRLISDFSEKVLLYPVIKNGKTNQLEEYSCYDLKNKKLAKEEDCGEGMIGEVTGYVTTKEIERFFSEVYGSKFTEKDSYDGCPMLYKSDEIDGYYIASPCGGTGFDTQYTYIYNREIKDGKVYVYVAYGIDDCCREKPIIYTDYKKKHKYTGKVTEDFKITADNYEAFSKYRFVFEKKSENYVFTGIELIEEK